MIERNKINCFNIIFKENRREKTFLVGQEIRRYLFDDVLKNEESFMIQRITRKEKEKRRKSVEYETIFVPYDIYGRKPGRWKEREALTDNHRGIKEDQI